MKASKSTRIAELLKSKRNELDWSIRDAAEKIGISEGSLSELENGKTAPKFETLLGIHLAYQIPIDVVVRLAALDRGVTPVEGDTEDISIRLLDRASTFPDLQQLLGYLAETDPKMYRAFLVMYQTWEAQFGAKS